MRIPHPDHVPPAAELGRIHFVGIGGAGLSAIARIMAARGLPVSGSDENDTPFLPQLRELGVRCHLGYDARHVAGLTEADTVVVTTAAREDNPEVLAARAAGVRLLPRSAGLASVMRGTRVLAVAGTHGKTTTTGLLTVAMLHCGVDPTYAVGGVLTATGRNADAGTGDWFVAEADESDGAFLHYAPYGVVVTNVEPEHLDHWGSPEAYHAGFERFLATVHPEGFCVLAVDDPGAARLVDAARDSGLRTVTVGIEAGADLRAVDLTFAGTTSEFTVLSGTRELGRVRLQIPGRHYVLDALAALAAALEVDPGGGFDQVAAGLGLFTGSGRRMELIGEAGGVRVFDSYAHTPAEIAADLDAARAIVGEGRLVVAFQPHLVSRTRLHGADMGRALGAADEVVVLDVYLAREEADPEVTGALVADAVPLPAGRVLHLADFDAVPAALVDRAGPGDLVLTLGAGTVTQLAPRALALLEGGAPDA